MSQPISCDHTPAWPQQLAQRASTASDPRLKRYFEAGCPDGHTPIADVPMVAVDFETTGLNPDEHSIVSIGLVQFDYHRIQGHSARHWLVHPLQPLHRQSVEIHGITHSDIGDAPDLEVVLEELLDSMAGRVAVVHYQAIERPFIDVAVKHRLGEGITFPVIDTMAIEAHLHPNRRLSWWQKLRGDKPISIRLADSRTRYHLPHYPPHHALTDALATAELLQAQLQHHFSPETPLGDLWL
ncbi:3'-5' exonuclease [Marinobacter zhejiangensis]|uniref:DNA polymerase-3 subunit epsilon n=1 Tax=Marinobacter zhejiangensis TaxID=488535 RepID=A0A1I4M5A4_9GAMM|nr:3'-5' exonuclease [Marinobacter zhejiangensis]SFL98518.1 DNA polymerase-3 subunit epsilon [Marinobacter zhejiangensis]